VKHKRLGEVVAAFLQRSDAKEGRPSDADLRDFVKEALGRHKAPEHIFWLGEDGIPSDVPLTGSGKVRKFEMREAAEQILKERNRGGRKL
jgi:mevalonyl-CoA ligase